MADIIFYDTCALLDLQEKVLKDPDNIFLISSVTLQEIESIKTSRNKDDEIKYKARNLIRILDQNPGAYRTIIYNQDIKKILDDRGLPETSDNQIVATAYAMHKFYANECNIKLYFETADICCRSIAKNIFELNTIFLDDEIEDEYSGYSEEEVSDDELAWFYEDLTTNMFQQLTNEYLILRDREGKFIDSYCWNGTCYQKISFPNIKSTYFGSVKPYSGDIYQQLALDSFDKNQLTMIKGPAGTGKSYLAIGYLLWLLEKRKIDRIIIFCNTVATLNSAKLGYYPGTKDQKLLDSSIGNMLSSKLGDSLELERLIDQYKIVLLPLSDIRGYDTSSSSPVGVYITEAQNMDVSLMKLALQRIGENSKCIIDGDYNAQVDMSQYAGNKNGMRRLSQVFRGQDFYGEVELKNIYRSKIARLAQEM